MRRASCAALLWFCVALVAVQARTHGKADDLEPLQPNDASAGTRMSEDRFMQVTAHSHSNQNIQADARVSESAEDDGEGEEGAAFETRSTHPAVLAADREDVDQGSGGMTLSDEERLPVHDIQPRLQQLKQDTVSPRPEVKDIGHGGPQPTPVTKPKRQQEEQEQEQEQEQEGKENRDDRPVSEAREEEADRDAASGQVSDSDCGSNPDLTFGSLPEAQAGRCLAFLWMKPGCTADGTAAPSLKDWKARTMRDAVVSFVLTQELSKTEETRARECCGAHKGMCTPGIHRRDATAEIIDKKHAADNAKQPTPLTPQQQRQYAIDKRVEGKNAVTPIGKPAVASTGDVGCVKAQLFRELEGAGLSLLQHRTAERWLKNRYVTVTNEAELREALNQGDVWITFKDNTDITLTQDLEINQPFTIVDGRGHYVRIRPSPALLALAVQQENTDRVPSIRITARDVVLTGLTFEGFTLIPEGSSWLTGCGGHGPGQPLRCYPLAKAEAVSIDEDATALWLHRLRFVRCGRAIVMKKFDKSKARLGASASLGSENVRTTALQVSPTGVVNTRQSHPPQQRHKPIVGVDMDADEKEESFREVATAGARAHARAGAGVQLVHGVLSPQPALRQKAPPRPKMHTYFHSPDEADNDDIEAVSQLNAEPTNDHSAFYPVQASLLQTRQSTRNKAVEGPEAQDEPGDGSEEARRPQEVEKKEDVVEPKQMTVSWCFFDTVYDGVVMDEAGMLTLHHSYFNSTFRRSPMCNGGESRMHIYNIWNDNFGYWGTAVREYCQAMVEGSTFTRGPHTHPKHFAVECVDKGKAILRDVYAPGGVVPKEPCTDGTAFDTEPCTDYRYTVAFDPEEERKCSIPVGCALEDVPHDRFHHPEDRKRCVRMPRWRETLANAVVPPVVSCRVPQSAADMLPSQAYLPSRQHQ